MAWLYILQSKTSGRFYIGSTNELTRRVSEHNRGPCLARRGRSPWELEYQETYATLLEARRRELEIKKWKSAAKIRDLIRVKIGQSGPLGAARSAVRARTGLPYPLLGLTLHRAAISD